MTKKKSTKETKNFKDFAQEKALQQVENDREVAKLRAKSRDLEAKNKLLLKKLEQSDRRAETIINISGPLKNVPSIKAKSKAKQIREGCPVILASDWHVGEDVDPKTVNGKNEYNPAIAELRAHRQFKGAASVINIWENGYNISEGVLWLGGDLITGYIHDELMESNHLSPTEEILLVRKLVTQGIEYLLKETSIKKLHIPCNQGNHGRISIKRKISTGAKNSFEWLLYKILEDQYAKDPRVVFSVADGAHLYLDVYDKTIRFHHGDDIKYWGGVGGLSTPMRKAVDAWNDYKHADITCIGHYHQARDYGDAVINGSLIGYGPFALSIKARYEKAQQGMFLMDRKYGKRMFTPIDVETE